MFDYSSRIGSLKVWHMMTSPDAPQNAAHVLEEDHARLGELLSGIFAALDAGNLQEAYERLDLFWAGLAVHIRAEHLRLFPAILDALAKDASESPAAELSVSEVRDLIARLRNDHDFFMRELAREVNSLREMLTDASDANGRGALISHVRQNLTNVGQLLVEHNQLEEENIYRWSAKFLSETEQVQLADGILREITNIPPRFSAL